MSDTIVSCAHCGEKINPSESSSTSCTSCEECFCSDFHKICCSDRHKETGCKGRYVTILNPQWRVNLYVTKKTDAESEESQDE